VIHTVALVAEAIRPDGGWVSIGPTPEGLWVVLARLGASAWVRFFSSREEAMARFLDRSYAVGSVLLPTRRTGRSS
jgi:hypothetical protein